MWKIEGIFAEAKSHHGMGRARCRGRKKVQMQVYMTAVAQNLKRLAANGKIIFIWVRAHLTLKNQNPIFRLKLAWTTEKSKKSIVFQHAHLFLFNTAYLLHFYFFIALKGCLWRSQLYYLSYCQFFPHLCLLKPRMKIQSLAGLKVVGSQSVQPQTR